MAPLLATALRVARRQGWDQRLLDGRAPAVAEAMERPEFRAGGRARSSTICSRATASGSASIPRLWMGLASLLGVLDRDRLVAALHAGLREVAEDRDHPLRAAGRRGARRSRAATGRATPRWRRGWRRPRPSSCRRRRWPRCCDDAAAALTRTLQADLAGERSELLAWLAERLERARVALVADGELRGRDRRLGQGRG